MTFSPVLRPFLLVLTLLAASVVHAQPRTDRALTTSRTLKVEIQALMNILERHHYNRDGVSEADFAQVIPSYMEDLDGQHMFFLASDKEAFLSQFPHRSLFWGMRNLADIRAAYDIFKVYETRAHDRAAWIFTQLEGGIDLDGGLTYAYDRKDAPWPADPAEADELWKRRITHEVLQEVLNKKSPEEAKATVRKRYDRMLRNLAELESLEIAELFLGAVCRLYDPHSDYLSADTLEDFNINMRLQLFGIGALLGVEDDVCVVREIVPGGPADLDKRLRPNDKIITVAQAGAEPVEVFGMKLRKIVDMIRGPKGTEVTLVVQPGEASDASERRSIVLTRDVVNLDSARAHAAVFDVPQADGSTRPLGVITLPAFYGADPNGEGPQNSASRDIADLLGRLKEAGVEGVVLDLRRNGGGLLSEAIELTGLFIPRGPVVQVRNYEGNVLVDEDEDPGVVYSGPLTVLVSKFSASASEIVAGALQNYGRAVVIGGAATHGKGSVQTVVEMKSLLPMLARAPEKAGATKLTVQKFYLPNGASTQLKGVVPDIVLPAMEDLLPVAEGDLPHALAWDEIPTAFFEGGPLPASVLDPLRQASAQRQQRLEEFSFLQRSIGLFRERQQDKEISLNLEVRKQQKEKDSTLRKEMESERKRLADASAYAFREIFLSPPPPPRIKAPPSEDEIDETVGGEDPDARYGKLDIHLREALRVTADIAGNARAGTLASATPPSPLSPRPGS